MTAPKRPSAEQLEDIRSFLNIKTDVMHLSELSRDLRDSLALVMAELDALRAEIKKSTYLEDMHREDCRRGAALEKERDQLQAENEKLRDDFNTVCRNCNRFNEENQQLRARVERLEKVISHVHKYASPEFGWAALLQEALAETQDPATTPRIPEDEL